MIDFRPGLLAFLVATSATAQTPADKNRATAAPEHRVSGVETAAVVDGHNRFAWDAYAGLRQAAGNIAFSPFSLARGLAMLHAGARGETADQIARVLHLPADNASAHLALKTLGIGLSGDAGPRGVKLNTSSALWASTGLGVPDEYVALIRHDYHASINQVDFQADSEQARKSMNAWVKAQTGGTIGELFQSGEINARTQLVLADVLLFQGAWAVPFKKERTRPGVFSVSPTRRVEVPFMQMSGKLRVAAGPAGLAVELAYVGRDVAFVALIPRRTDGLADVEKQLVEPLVSDWLRQLKPETVNLSLPRFNVTTDMQLENLLAQLGMPLAFRPLGADFSGLCTSDEPLAITDVAQKVHIKVDESGTEAVAVTTFRSSRGLVDQNIREIKADRPFVFLLRDMRNGSILFVGRLADPTPSR
jgi:serine protease inhibitor